MAGLFTEYHRRMRHEHGWQVPLDCPVCRHLGVPDFEGWTPQQGMNFGDRPTIYADLACENCGHDLHDTAGEKLVELFTEVSTPGRNRRLLWTFVGLMVVVPLLLVGLICLGVRLGWWGPFAYTILSGLSLLVVPTIFWINWQVHRLRHECPCGQPDYLFMGLLGRSSCYRCSTCGRLLRLRD